MIPLHCGGRNQLPAEWEPETLEPETEEQRDGGGARTRPDPTRPPRQGDPAGAGLLRRRLAGDLHARGYQGDPQAAARLAGVRAGPGTEPIRRGLHPAPLLEPAARAERPRP